MPNYTPTYQLRQPMDQELVSYGAATITENADKLEAALLDAKWFKGNLASNTDLNNVKTPGLYRIATYSVATSLTNAPPTINVGTLEVLAQSASTVVQRITLSAGFSGSAVWQRSSVLDGWDEPWSNTSRVAVQLPSGADLNDYTTPGAYGVATSSLASSIVNLEESQPCHIEVDRVATSTFSIVFQTVRTETKIKYRTLSSTGQVSDWAQVWPAETGSSVGSGPSWGKAAARARRLGGFGTDGRAVVALTFDHGLDNLTEHLADYAMARGVPYTVAVSTAEVGLGENSAVQWTDLQTLAVAGGVELANHSPSHANRVGSQEIYDAVVGSRQTMLDNMPDVAVDSFIMPGHGVVNGWDGLGFGGTHEEVSSTYAGQLIQETHGVFTATIPGSVWPSEGDLTAGARRLNLDAASWITAAENLIRRTVTTGVGGRVILIGHPVYWGESGRPTVERLKGLIDTLAQLRDQGDIVLATLAGAAFSRASDSLVPRIDDPSAWVSGEQTIDLAPTPQVLGAVWQVEAPGATSIVIAADGVAVASGAGAYRPFTIPRTASTLTITTTGATSTPIVRPI